MVVYLDGVKAMLTKIRDFKIRQILWKENKKADVLANLVSTFEFISNKNILLEFLPSPSIDITKTICQSEVSLT